MPLHNYGVLKGTARNKNRGGGPTPHFEIEVDGGGKLYRIAVNVESKESPSEVLFLVNEHFSWVRLQQLKNLSPGFKLLHKQDQIAVDYVRSGVVDPSEMTPLPADVSGPDNDLEDLVDKYITKAISTPGAFLYAFGDKFGPQSGKDKIFGFSPELGIHDIHMNQGNVAGFVQDDGVFQDGALLINLPKNDQWIAIFLAFQSQSFQTDDHTGHRITGAAMAAAAGAGHTAAAHAPKSKPHKRKKKHH